MQNENSSHVCKSAHKTRTGSQGDATASDTSAETDSPATVIDLAASAPRLSLYASAGRLFSGERCASTMPVSYTHLRAHETD